MSLLCLSVLVNAGLADGWAAPPPAGAGGAWDPSADPRDARGLLPDAPADDDYGVVGGTQVPEGKWDDAVGVVFSGQYVGCTGTLVGPRVVLTAGHCVIGSNVTHVVVGRKDWTEEGGEVIEVDGVHEYPNSQSTYDIAVLTLAQRSAVEPRAIAIDCVLRDHLDDGAPVQIVGYGLTTESGTGWNTKLNEVASVVLDKDCDESVLNGISSGCHGSVSPGGEIAAGGNGADACYGDSGGPLYLKTGDRPYLVGVTSRAFAGISPNAPCRDGGIWVRPDAVLSWIEEQAGNLSITYPVCNEPPDAVVDEIRTTAGEPGRVTVEIEDPDGADDEATVDVAVEPEHGEVEIDGHDLVYTPDEGFVGEDEFTIVITDGGTSRPRTGTPVSIELDVAAVVEEAPEEAPAGCGCAPGGAAGGFGAGALAWIALIRRRR